MRCEKRLFVLAGCALAAIGCGSAGSDPVPATASDTTRGTGISIAKAPGWHSRIRRGALHAATFPLPQDSRAFTREASARVRDDDDVLVLLFESEPHTGGPPFEYSVYEQLNAAPQLAVEDFAASDGLTDDSAQSGHGFARRLFELSGRYFALFVESGSRPPPEPVLRSLNALLAGLHVEPGDFTPGTVEPALFAAGDGWHVGTSGAVERRADGEWTTSWAATIPYADEWNALPPQRTLERLPADGIVIWAALSRSNRFPPPGDPAFPDLEPPLRLDGFEQRASWEGQVGDLPEYVLWGGVRGQYQLDLRIYFGRPEPTAPMRSRAQAMLDGLVLPDWGAWDDAG